MKWKNNIVVLAAYLIGTIYGFALEEAFKKTKNEFTDCRSICSNYGNTKNTYLEKDMCKCSKKPFTDRTMLNIGEAIQSNQNFEANIKHEEKKKVKRQIMEFFDKKIKSNRTPTKSLKLFSTENPITRNRLNKNIYKSQQQSKTSGLFRNNQQSPRLRKIGERIRDLKERMSPRLQSRGSFSEVDRPKNLVTQLKDRKEEIINDFKSLRSRSMVDKGTNPLHERVGSVNLLQNRIGVGSSLKDELKQTGDKESIKGKTNVKTKENEGKDKTRNLNKQLTTSETPKSTSSIPEIVLGQSVTPAPKTETVVQNENLTNPQDAKKIESSTKKIETVSLALEKMKEKQKETVMKIKDKFAKNKTKNLDVGGDNNSAKK